MTPFGNYRSLVGCGTTLQWRLTVERMSTVAEIIEAVKKLGENGKGELLAKLADIDFGDAWDRQIEADAKAGRLDRFAEEAIRDYRAGNSRPFVNS